MLICALIRDWRAGITHILAADRINHEDLITWLNKNGVNHVSPGTAIVNELYVPWCIELNRVLDPDQPQYFIKGYGGRNHAVAQQKLSSSTSEADHIPSMHVRNEAPEGTPDTAVLTDTSSHLILGRHPSWNSSLPRNFDDELSRATEEAQATKEVVSIT